MAERYLIDPEVIETHLLNLSREPFQKILALLLNCAPDEKSIRQFGNKYPDRLMQAITMAAKLTGYTEKTQHVSKHLHLHLLSDSQLWDRRMELEKQLAELEAKAEPSNVSNGAEKDHPEIKSI